MKGWRTLKIVMVCYFVNYSAINAQCPPTITLSSANAEVIIDGFSKYTSGVTRYGITTLNSTAAACIWDIYARATLTQGITYSATGTPLSLDNLRIRAVNGCETPDQVYGIPNVNPITGTFTTPLSVQPNYIVGTPGADGVLAKSQVPCFGTAINQNGSPTLNATVNKFRIDMHILPGISPVVQPGVYDLVIDFFADEDGTGASNSEPFSLRIEILPVLELNVKTLNQVNFIFDDIRDYMGGITKYGATILNVNSSVAWDLVAVGTSTVNENTGGASAFWDQNIPYSSTGSSSIPISVLELHQTPANPSGGGALLDYSLAFTIPPSGNNYLVSGSQNGATVTLSGTRTVAGKTNATDPALNNAIAPGSYINNIGGGFSSANYKYVIDYRLLPGLPSTFNGLMAPVQPGIYTMEIRYILTEDQ